METLEIYQGTTQPLTLELAGKGTVTIVEVKVFKFKNGNKKLDSQHKYPEEEGWEEITKDADNYTLTLTKEITEAMEGAYGVEATYTTAEIGQIRVQTSGLTVLTKVE